jgi:hypothetical protein
MRSHSIPAWQSRDGRAVAVTAAGKTRRGAGNDDNDDRRFTLAISFPVLDECVAMRLVRVRTARANLIAGARAILRHSRILGNLVNRWLWRFNIGTVETKTEISAVSQSK